MGDYNNDDMEEEELVEEEQTAEEQGGSNRNFLLALGILGGIFVLLVIALVIIFLTRPRSTEVTNINATNAVIMTANAATASAATQAAALLLTPSITPTATNTLLPTATSVVAIASPTATTNPTDQGSGTGGLVATATVAADKNAPTVAALLTQQAPTFVAQTQAALGQKTNTPAAGAVKGTGTTTALPTTGFADEVGLPGLFGLAIGLVVLIVVVRRLRLQPR